MGNACRCPIENSPEALGALVPSLTVIGSDDLGGSLFDDKEVEYEGGARYIGQMVGGLRHGLGRHEDPEWVYEGQWRMGRQDGKGEMLWNNGNRYQGQFVDNEFSGCGHMRWFAEGVSYRGQYVADLKHGHGVFTWADGRTYDGEWVRGLRWGRAVVTEGNGCRREALWENDVRVRTNPHAGAVAPAHQPGAPSARDPCAAAAAGRCMTLHMCRPPCDDVQEQRRSELNIVRSTSVPKSAVPADHFELHVDRCAGRPGGQYSSSDDVSFSSPGPSREARSATPRRSPLTARQLWGSEQVYVDAPGQRLLALTSDKLHADSADKASKSRRVRPALPTSEAAARGSDQGVYSAPRSGRGSGGARPRRRSLP